MTFKLEILIFGQQMKMDINKFLFIYFIIMDEFHLMIYLFNSIHRRDLFMQKMTIIHMKSFIYGHVHSCRWIKITLSFKLQAQSSKLRFYSHAQAIFLFNTI
jgi:hypothetical protein